VACDGLGHPLRVRLTPGQWGDAPEAAALVVGLTPGALVADAAYDSDALRAWAASVGAEAVIPPNRSRSLKPSYDEGLYAERNRIERFFGRLKRCRRVATRYEQTGRNYLAFVQLASTVVMLT
jgi:transposase